MAVVFDCQLRDQGAFHCRVQLRRAHLELECQRGVCPRALSHRQQLPRHKDILGLEDHDAFEILESTVLNATVPRKVKLPVSQGCYGVARQAECGCGILYPSEPRAPESTTVTHELCRLSHHDHSAGFVRLLNARMPDWTDRKAFLGLIASKFSFVYSGLDWRLHYFLVVNSLVAVCVEQRSRIFLDPEKNWESSVVKRVSRRYFF